jgi:hypothetical protein
MNYKVIGLLFIVSSFLTTLKTKNHLDKETLKGNVKSVKELAYAVKEVGNTITKTERKRVYSNDSDSYKTFNEQGNYIEVSYYESDDTFMGKYSYTYDSEDHNTQLNWSDSKNVLIQKHQYVYDTKGNATVYKMFYADDRGLYFTDSITYDTYGNRIEEIRYHPNNIDVINKKSYTYNTEGLKTEKRRWGKVKSSFQYEFNSKSKKTAQREYDENERLLSEIKYNNKENIVEEWSTTPINSTKVVYSYNTKEQLIKTFQTDTSNDDKVLRELVTEYTYDSHGNWITQTTFVNTSPRSLIEREITYY